VRWSVGKALDTLAQRAALPNANNVPGAQRLSLFNKVSALPPLPGSSAAAAAAARPRLFPARPPPPPPLRAPRRPAAAERARGRRRGRGFRLARRSSSAC